MDLLHHGVYRFVIALWLGRESVETTALYLQADMKLKEQALAKTDSADIRSRRYKPDDRLLAFLKSLCLYRPNSQRSPMFFGRPAATRNNPPPGIMTNIVQSWRPKLAVGATDSGGSSDMLEPGNNPHVVPRPAIARGERRGFLPRAAKGESAGLRYAQPTRS